MHEELEQTLFQRWPAWFDIQGFEHGDGWFGILWRLFADLRPLVDELEGQGNQSFAVVRVREERGGLRVYVNDGTDAIYERIQAAEEESYHVCEICGEPGSLRQNGWIRTRCAEHAED
jgi:hypothetical protein